MIDIKRIHLPVDDILECLCQILAQRSCAVLVAEPGAGKTTRVPVALHQQSWLAGRKVLMLEPRRLAARAAAQRMAQEMGEAVGVTVGYRTRLDTRVSAATRIEVVTEGVLTRMILDDPSLDDYGVVIFDEFHERSLVADTGLALALEVQKALRPDLRLLVMSATLDAAAVSRLLGDAPLVECAGRTFPVDVSYSPPGKTPWLDHAAHLVRQALPGTGGSVLVFVPGHREMHRLLALLDGTLPSDCRLYALAGSLSPAAQDQVLGVEPDGARKVVIATAVAETSLTIPGIRLVIDGGYQRLPVFDVGAGMGRLVTRRVSRAAADQRAGRAGRQAPGRVIRLWPASEVLAAHTPPEILSADLCALMLDLAEWGCRDPAQLDWLDVPPTPAWQQARSVLEMLGLLDGSGALTDLGRRCRRLPLHPRLARMLVAGRDTGRAGLAARLAVLLGRSVPLPSGMTDLHRQLALFQNSQVSAALNRELKPLLHGEKVETQAPRAGDVGALLLSAFPERLARRRPGKAPRFLLRNGRGAWLADDSELADANWLVAASLDGDAREARIFSAAVVDEDTIETQLANDIETREVLLPAEQGKVRCLRQRVLGAIILDETPVAQPDAETLRAFFLQQLQQQGAQVLPWTPALRQWQARVQRLHRLAPTQWPDVSDEALVRDATGWAAPFMAAVTRARNWSALPLQDALRCLLDYPQQQQLDALLPTHVQVPSGSRLAIDYIVDGDPVLRVKLQEMFGVQQTPTLAQGNIGLQLHLLSPAQRPVAVTADLASFWQQGYPQVRKDLRGRYPKHPWPEDPLTAAPQRGVKRRPD